MQQVRSGSFAGEVLDAQQSDNALLDPNFFCVGKSKSLSHLRWTYVHNQCSQNRVRDATNCGKLIHKVKLSRSIALEKCCLWSLCCLFGSISQTLTPEKNTWLDQVNLVLAPSSCKKSALVSARFWRALWILIYTSKSVVVGAVEAIPFFCWQKMRPLLKLTMKVNEACVSFLTRSWDLRLRCSQLSSVMILLVRVLQRTMYPVFLGWNFRQSFQHSVYLLCWVAECNYNSWSSCQWSWRKRLNDRR